MKIFLSLMLAVIFLSGCGAIGMGGQTKTTTTTTTDPQTLATTTTVVEESVPAPTSSGFFKSENLEEHYKFETARNTSHESTATKKVDAITENTGKIMALEGPTATEKLLTGVIANMQIAAIQTSLGPSGVPTPKTMVDAADKNFGNIWMLVLGIWDRVDNKIQSSDDDTSVNIENTGDGMVFYQSDKNSAYSQSAKYTLGDSEGDLSFSAPSFAPTNTTTDRNDTTNTSTRTDSNDSSTLW